MSAIGDIIKKLPKLGYFSSIPAGMMDRSYAEKKPTSFLGTLGLFLKIRIQLLFFVVALAIDTIASFLIAFKNFVFTMFTSENTQAAYLEQQKLYATNTGKSLFAFLASMTFIPLFYPKLLFFYFTPTQPKATGVTAGGDYHHASKAEIRTPKTKEDLQAIVREAIEKGKKIIPKGAGRSQGRQFIPEEGVETIVIDMCEFKEIDTINPDTKTARVGAGVLWSELQVVANQSKLAVKVMQASNVFSVGGSIGTNIHGWDYHSGMILNTLKSMDIVNGRGEFQTVTPDCGLIRLDNDPNLILQNDFQTLKTRSQNQPTYALFDDKLFYVDFANDPVVTPLKHELLTTEFKSLFPQDNKTHKMANKEALGKIFKTTNHTPLFYLIAGGFGLFGIVYRVTMELADNEHLKRIKADKVSPTQYVKYFKDNLKDKPEKRLHLYRLSLDPNHLLEEGFTETYTLDTTKRNPTKTEAFSLEQPQGNRLDRVLVNFARRFGWMRKLWWDRERQNFLNNEPVATTNEIMQAPINAMFNPSVSESEWLQEYFIPENNLAEFIKEFGQLMMKNNVSLLNATVRFVKQESNSPLSYAADGDRFAVVICFNQSLEPSEINKTRTWLRQAQKLAVEHNGTYYLPYQDVSSPDLFKKGYPKADVFYELKKQADPLGIFTSGLYEKYINPKSKTVFHTKAVFDDANKDEFKGFLTHILKRIDAEELYPLLENILTYTDSDIDVYEALCSRLDEIRPSTLTDIRNKLNSLAAIKEDLTAQAKSLLPDGMKINGIMEIGSPGRYINGFREHFEVKGPIIAVNDDDASVADYVDAGNFHPYDTFKKLNYNDLDCFEEIPDKSVDLITCYVGLHHFSDEKLDEFLHHMQRILRPDGCFLLDDHDITDEKTNHFAHLAHLVFNAVNGVSLENERSEIRNFKSMTHWKNKLQQFDLLGIETQPNVEQIRQGDPTRNSMIVTRKSQPTPVDEMKVNYETGPVVSRSDKDTTESSNETSNSSRLTSTGSNSHGFFKNPQQGSEVASNPSHLTPQQEFK